MGSGRGNYYHRQLCPKLGFLLNQCMIAMFIALINGMANQSHDMESSVHGS